MCTCYQDVDMAYLTCVMIVCTCYQDVDMASLTCVTIVVCTVWTEVRETLTSLKQVSQTEEVKQSLALTGLCHD